MPPKRKAGEAELEDRKLIPLRHTTFPPPVRR